MSQAVGRRYWRTNIVYDFKENEKLEIDVVIPWSSHLYYYAYADVSRTTKIRRYVVYGKQIK